MLIIDPTKQTPPDEGWCLTPSGLAVPAESWKQPTCVDLFCGGGGFSLGFMQAGFDVVGAVDDDPMAVIAYCVNLCRPGVSLHFDTEEREAAFARALVPRNKKKKLVGFPVAGSGWIAHEPCTVKGVQHVWVGDARKLKGSEMLRVLGLDDVDCVIGGPPCQGFSSVGKRNVADPRNNLVFEFARLAIELRAKSIVMENVPGMAFMVTPEGIPVVDVFIDTLENGGYGKAEMIRRALTGKPSARAFVKKPDQPLAKTEQEQASLFE